MACFRIRPNACSWNEKTLGMLSLLALAALASTFVISACKAPPTSISDFEPLANAPSGNLMLRQFDEKNTPSYVVSESNPSETPMVERDSMLRNPACVLVPGCCSLNGWFWDFDTVNGPMHTNTTIKLYNSVSYPQHGANFYGRVTSASDHFRCAGNDEGGGCPEGFASFHDGYQLNVPAVNCQVDYTEAETCVIPEGGGLLLPSHETWITLNADGSMWVYQPEGDPPYSDEPNGPFALSNEQTGALVWIPPSKVVGLGGTDEDGDIHLQGTLSGQLTILAGRRIYVEGDILFNIDPRTGRSREKLGLLAGWKTPAEGHLVIPDINPSGPDGDRLVFANYVGPDCNAGIVVQDYNVRHYEGILTLYGSVFQGTWKPATTGDSAHGYWLDFVIDPRACASPPPCFPSLELEG